MQQDKLQLVQEYAQNILRQLPPKFCYHNALHTESVVEATKKIAQEEGVKEKALESLLMAAWLHDIGYSVSCDDHETHSMMLAKEFLQSIECSDKQIEKVLSYIEATRMPQTPHSHKQMILCDADLSHLASEDFLEKTEHLRTEISLTVMPLSEKDWLKKTVTFMEEHHYFTAFGKRVLNQQKQKNMALLQKRLEDIKQSKKESKEKEKEVENKVKRPDRGIETMFRTTSANHFQLSAMADNKANIMISVNTIVISLIVSILIRKLEENEYLIVPTIMITTVCLMATVFAVLSTIPNVTKGKFSKEDITNRSANLLFFGNFHEMQLEDYQAGMKEMMNDSEFLYSSMTRDIYFLGKVLGRKYKLLRIAYNIFMYGFVASILAFGIAAVLQKHS
ncbi:MAG: Pycsar system effector family protein [Flectobacillus sp.]|uniref:Pycsar system effector family protein n=1 Tax=Flectobacillus sp. TaxID=50419 RepID=UPI003B9BB313